MPNKTQMAFARQVYAAAVEANTEIDPAFVTAQAMLETGWGSKVIGRPTSSALPREASGMVLS